LISNKFEFNANSNKGAHENIVNAIATKWRKYEWKYAFSAHDESPMQI